VRPLLPEDGITTEGKVISYPTSLESLGRGIDVTQNGTFLGGRILDNPFLFCLISIIRNI
jgi:hypothetical protein